MTAPGLTLEQREAVEVLVTPAAWAFHRDLLHRGVGLEQAYRVHGDVRLIAADVLTTAAAASRAAAAASAAMVKRFRVEGEYEEEYFAQPSPGTVDADAWETLAARLRAEVAAERRTGRRRGSTSTRVEVGF